MGVYNRRWGVPLSDGGTVRVPRLVGQGRALELIMTGRKVNADECLRIGLCEMVVPKGQAREAAEAMAQAPIPTALGSWILQSTCQACWREWLRAQVILINEHRLSLMDPEARKILEGQMRSFLNLASEQPE